MNWKAQTLPIIVSGLPCSSSVSDEDSSRVDWTTLPQPPLREIQRRSPLAQIKLGNYKTPTFLVHGTKDELIPWQQSHKTWKCIVSHGIDAKLALIKDAPHICDTSKDHESAGWKAVLRGYGFLADNVRIRGHWSALEGRAPPE